MNVHTRIITKYNTDHQRICDIFAKYWHLLLGDDKVAKFIPSVPSITYRWGHSNRDRLVHSNFRPIQQDREPIPGTTRCHKCKECP